MGKEILPLLVESLAADFKTVDSIMGSIQQTLETLLDLLNVKTDTQEE